MYKNEGGKSMVSVREIKTGRSIFKGIVVSILLSIILLSLITGCATSYKHKKHKAIPCPCETQQRR